MSVVGQLIVYSKFSHPNVFDSLRDINDDAEELIPVSAETPASTSAAVRPAQHKDEQLDEQMSKLHITKRRDNRKLLPPWDTDFWAVYGNKLRVFGTEEEVCDLTDESKPRTTSTVDRADEKADAAVERRPSLWEAFQRWYAGGGGS